MKRSIPQQKHLKYIDLDEEFKVFNLDCEVKEKIYKLRETITTPKALIFPYLSTEYKSKKNVRLIRNPSPTDPPKHITQRSEITVKQGNKSKRKESSTQTPKLKPKEIHYPLIKPFYTLPIQANLTETNQPPYQLIDVLSDVVDKVSENYSNAPRINIMRSEYLINKITKDTRKLHNKLILSRKEIKSKEEEEEQCDTVVYEDYYETRLKSTLRNYLRTKDNKLNQTAKTNALDDFFHVFENRINFIYDVYTVPYFMNKFIRFNLENLEQMKQFNSHNYIDSNILRYLYRLKVKVQREKDETEQLKKKREQTGAEDKKDNQNQVLAGKVLFDIENKNDLNTLPSQDQSPDRRLMLEKAVSINPKVFPIAKSSNQKESGADEEESTTYSIKVYEMEDFFIHKYIRYEGIGVANEKERDFILNKFNDLSFKDYYSVHIPQVMSKL